MQPTRALSAILLAAVVLVAFDADAKLVKLEIAKREVVADGMAFGDAGPYEKLTGRAWFEVDPALERNKSVFDLDRAPVNAGGKVEFSADMVILKPVNTALVRKPCSSKSTIAAAKSPSAHARYRFGREHERPDRRARLRQRLPDEARLRDCMGGLGRGHCAGDNRLTVNFPIAQENGKPVTERILTEFSDRNFNGGKPFSLPLSGSPAFKSFPAISVDKKQAQAELYTLASDSPKPGAPDIPRGEALPDDQWAFADCPDGWPGKPSAGHLCLKDGFRNDRNYHLIYRATDSPVMGLGYVTTRDFVSFLHNDEKDAAGNANRYSASRPRYARHLFVRHVPARLSLPGLQRRRTGTPGLRRHAHPHCRRAEAVPELSFRATQSVHAAASRTLRARHQFPRQYAVRINPFNGVPDGILKRPKSDPKIIHTDTSNEYWQFRASLTGASEGGKMDFNESSKVRRYLLSSQQHGGFKPDAPEPRHSRQAVRAAHQRHASRPLLRALVVALDDWVRKNVAPPETRVPRISIGPWSTPRN